MSEYLHVITDPAHVLAELTFIVVFDVIIGALLWPFVKRAVRNHDRRWHR